MNVESSYFKVGDCIALVFVEDSDAFPMSGFLRQKKEQILCGSIDPDWLWSGRHVVTAIRGFSTSSYRVKAKLAAPGEGVKLFVKDLSTGNMAYVFGWEAVKMPTP